jgi:hypothetical protein
VPPPGGPCPLEYYIPSIAYLHVHQIFDFGVFTNLDEKRNVEKGLWKHGKGQMRRMIVPISRTSQID